MAPKLQINSLIAIIDYNNWASSKWEITSFDLYRKMESFGWFVQEIDGHNFHEIHNAFQNCHKQNNKPSIVIAHTIKGVSFRR